MNRALFYSFFKGRDESRPYRDLTFEIKLELFNKPR